MHRHVRSLLLISISLLQAQTQFQTGALHHGVYPAATVNNSVESLWSFQTAGAVRSTPVIAGNRIIVGSSDGTLYCVNRNGAVQWKYRADGPISSSPAIAGKSVLFTSRVNTLTAVNVQSGKIQWKRSLGRPLEYPWGFDYYISSPTVENGVIYTGSGDGNLFALNAADGSVRWMSRASSLIRSTPAVDAECVYFGDNNGKVFALDKRNGSQRWVFSTRGDTADNEHFGFDRKAVIASPTVTEDALFVGSRDGFLYALDKRTGTVRWKYDYKVSWVISTAAIAKGLVITGTSDGRFVHALDAKNGTERWRFRTQATVWASPSVSGNDVVVIPSNDGYLYALDLMNGAERWRYKLGPQIFASVLLSGDTLFTGCDDGRIIALRSFPSSLPPISSVKRAVFWMKEPPYQLFRSGMDVAVRDHFIREGYSFLDETDLKGYLLSAMKSDTASVVVFATNYLLPEVTNDTLGSNILQSYLTSGGRVVMLGMNPAAYEMDSTGKQIKGINFLLARKLTGIPYQYRDLRTHGGFYSATVTTEGKTWGLSSPFTAIAALPVSAVTTPLALDENGNTPAWVRYFGGRKNSGYIQLFLTSDRLPQLPEIQAVAEWGLR